MSDTNSKPQPTDFEAAQAQGSASLPAELWQFLKTNKKWWLTPMILVLLLVGALVVLGGSAAAPFVYTLF